MLERWLSLLVLEVLGTSVENIVSLPTKDFLTLVALSFVVSIPIVRYTMHKWLQNFAYGIELGWWMFLGAVYWQSSLLNMAGGSVFKWSVQEYIISGMWNPQYHFSYPIFEQASYMRYHLSVQVFSTYPIREYHTSGFSLLSLLLCQR